MAHGSLPSNSGFQDQLVLKNYDNLACSETKAVELENGIFTEAVYVPGTKALVAGRSYHRRILSGNYVGSCYCSETIGPALKMTLSTAKQTEHPYDWAVDGPPIGEWKTEDGSFSAMMGSVLTINKDGTGLLYEYSPMQGEHSWDLVWRHVGRGHMQIIQFWDNENESAIADDRWENVHYTATWIESDVRRSPVLKNLKTEGFWNVLSAMSLSPSSAK